MELILIIILLLLLFGALPMGPLGHFHNLGYFPSGVVGLLLIILIIALIVRRP